MFNKKFILFLGAALLCAASHAGIGQPEEGTPIPIVYGTKTEYSVPPKAPALIPMDCIYYPGSESIVADFHYSLGPVTIEVENHTTGEYSQTAVNALAGPMVLPISGTSGNWTITFTLSSGVQYCGEFSL